MRKHLVVLMYELTLIQVFANAQTILFDLNNEVVLSFM